MAVTSSHQFKNQYEFNLFQSDPGINSDQQQRKALYIFLSENEFLSYKLTSIKSKPNTDMKCIIRIKCLISTSWSMDKSRLPRLYRYLYAKF